MTTSVLEPGKPFGRTVVSPALARYPLTQGVNPWLVTVSVMLPTFMEVLDTAIASVALPYIAGSLSASNSEATWVLTSYLVANAVILPASNWFARRFGRKNFLLFCVIVFTIASFFCGAAPSLAIILLARVLQGAGGGALQPLSQSILLESFPIEKRSQAMAAYGLGIVVAPVLGPTLGGWLTDTFSWRYAFYINIPVGILAVIMISRFVHDPPYIKNAKVGAFDNIGFGLLIVWTGCLQIVLDKGQEDDWFGAVWVRWAVAALIAAFVGWVWRSWFHERGLVDLHVLKDRNFRTGCFLIALLGMCIYITIAILPLYFQEILGYTAFSAGLVVGPRGIGSFIGSPIIGFLGSRIDPRKLLSVGFIGFGVCSLIFGTVNLDIGPHHAVDSHHAHRLCAQLCVRAAGHAVHIDHFARGDGERHRPVQHAAQHRRIDRDRDGLDGADPPRGVLPDRDRSAPVAVRSGAAAPGGDGRRLPDASAWPRSRAPRRLRPDVRRAHAAGRTARVCRCFPLDRGAGVLLRRRGLAVQEAGEAPRAAAGRALIFEADFYVN